MRPAILPRTRTKLGRKFKIVVTLLFSFNFQRWRQKFFNSDEKSGLSKGCKTNGDKYSVVRR